MLPLLAVHANLASSGRASHRTACCKVYKTLYIGFTTWQVLTFYLSIGVQTHRANADAIFGKLEAMVAQDMRNLFQQRLY